MWEFLAEKVLGDIFDWLYSKLIEGLSTFFEMMNGMSAELFDMPWVSAVVDFFFKLGWSLYGVGLLVALFETAMSYHNGRTDSVQDLGRNAIRGFLAVGLFSTVPIELFKFCVSLQGTFATNLAGIDVTRTGVSAMAMMSVQTLTGQVSFVSLFLAILLGYAVIKVFFSGLKRGGILLIQIAVGSLYLFSVPRGYHDSFYGWCKQVIGVCLTMFLQSTVLIAGLLVWNTNMLMGCGLMLAATEVPRIAGQFGLETSTRANIMSAVYATQTVVNMTRNIGAVLAKP